MPSRRKILRIWKLSSKTSKGKKERYKKKQKTTTKKGRWNFPMCIPNIASRVSRKSSVKKKNKSYPFFTHFFLIFLLIDFLCQFTRLPLPFLIERKEKNRVRNVEFPKWQIKIKTMTYFSYEQSSRASLSYHMDTTQLRHLFIVNKSKLRIGSCRENYDCGTSEDLNKKSCWRIYTNKPSSSTSSKEK